MSHGHNFSLEQRRTLGTLSKNFEQFFRAHRTYSRFFQKEFHLKIWKFVRIFQLHLSFIFLQNLIFLLFLTYIMIYTLIGMAYGNDCFTFIWILRTFSRCLKSSVTVSCLWIREKSDHAIQQSNYMSRKNEKSWDLEKMKINKT